MRTSGVIAATISLAASVGALPWLALSAAQAQGPRFEVVIDLLAIKPGAVVTIPAPLGDPFLLRLDNRAPSALYQVIVEEPGRVPQTKELGLPFDSMLRTLPIASCAELQRREQELMRSAEEDGVPAKVGAIREEARTSSCTMSKGMVDLFVDQSRPVIRSYVLAAEQWLKVTIERLAADTKAVQRRWQVTLQPSVPKPGAGQATEEQWIVTEVSRDVAEMAIYARTGSLADAAALALAVQRIPDATGAPSYGVSLRPDASPQPMAEAVALADHVWSPRTYEPLARALLGRLRLSASANPPEPGPSALAALTDLRATAIEAANRRVSAWLRREMTSAEAHEQAALILAALGLREAAGKFDDRRPALSRMAAHLAMALALRGGKPASPSGEYAEIALLTMVGRTRDALGRLDTVQKAPLSPEARAWANALRTFNTGDWRVQTDAARASLLERRAQFEALSTGLGSVQALEFLSSRAAEAFPDWGRFALQADDSVEAAHFFAPGAVALELTERDEVWKVDPAPAPQTGSPVPALNEAPGRCIGRDATGRVVPRVIDRGTWARFFQRHLLHLLDAVDHQVRQVLGLPDQANDARDEARREFGNLLLFPLLEVRWQIGDQVRNPTAVQPRRPSKPGLDACPAAVRLLRETPEAVTLPNWDAVDGHCARQRETGQLPAYAAWFTPPIPGGTAFQAYTRLFTGPLSLKYDVAQLELLLAYAPLNRGLLQVYVARKFGATPDPKEVAHLLGPLLDYDLWAMKWHAGLLEDDVTAFRRAYETICRLDPDSCLTLAWYLVDREIDDAAVVAFEDAVKKGRNLVRIVSRIGWLMDYYIDHGRPEDALKLAQMGADAYSVAGLRLMARLMERMGRYQEAESYYAKIVERYNWRESLDRFYVRYEQRIGDGRFRAEAQEALKRLFPNGLQRSALADLSVPPQPGKGHLVTTKPSPAMDRVGLRKGDVVVVIDGYLVDSREQYETVLNFTDKRDLALIVWRGGRYVELKGQVRREHHGPASTSPLGA